MPAVTYIAEDFEVAAPLGASSPRFRFVPVSVAGSRSAIGVNGPYLHFPKAVTSLPTSSTETTTVSLVATTELEGIDGYIVEVEWLDGAGNPLGFAALDGIVRVPAEGGAVGDLLAAPPPPGSIVVSFGPPSPTDLNVVWIDISDENEDGVAVYAPGEV